MNVIDEDDITMKTFNVRISIYLDIVSNHQASLLLTDVKSNGSNLRIMDNISGHDDHDGDDNEAEDAALATMRPHSTTIKCNNNINNNNNGTMNDETKYTNMEAAIDRVGNYNQ